MTKIEKNIRVRSFKKGFTLIELLVVIAIIGTLSSIVLLSLNVVRARGANTKTKAQLASARDSASMFFDNYNSYNGFAGDISSDCTTIDSMFQDTDSGMIQYTDPDNYPNPATFSIRCSSVSDTYVISASLSDPTQFWCIDSSGFSGEITAADHATAHPNDATACS